MDDVVSFAACHGPSVVALLRLGCGGGDRAYLACRIARQDAVVDGVADDAVQNALGFLRRSGALCLSDPLQEAAEALGIIRLLECEAAQR